MKRFFAVLFLCLLVALPALADNRVFDDADSFTVEEESLLNDTIAEIYASHNFDVVLHTTPSLGGKAVRDYAADYFDYGGFGYGENADGLIFVISMAERDYVTVTTGSGIQIFTDYGIEQIELDAKPYLSQGDYFGAMKRYLGNVSDFIVHATKNTDEKGAVRYTPYDVDSPVRLKSAFERLSGIAPAVILIALGVALVVVSIMRASMKTARSQPDAASYVIDGSLSLTRREDIYLYTTTTRTKIESNNSSGGGGSSTFRGSSGRIHGGGRGGKF